MKDQNVLPVFTELKDLCSDPMLPATRASRLIESEKLRNSRFLLQHIGASSFVLVQNATAS
jgi:hypothetical protein